MIILVDCFLFVSTVLFSASVFLMSNKYLIQWSCDLNMFIYKYNVFWYDGIEYDAKVEQN